jgi:ATP-binding cassette subfamily B protein
MNGKSQNIKYPEVRIKDIASYLWRAIKGDWLSLVLIIVGVSAANVFDIIIPLYYKQFFDLLSSSLDKGMLVQELINALLIILALGGGQWLFWRITSFSVVYFEGKVMANLRRQAYSILIRHSYNFFANNFTGALVQRVGRYSRSFERLADRIIFNFLPLVIRLTGITIVVFGIERKLAFVILGWAILYMVVNYFYSTWRVKYNIKMAEADSRTTAVLADNISNQNNISIFNRFQREDENFVGVTEDQRKITTRNWNFNMGLDAIQGALIVLIEFFIFYFTIHYWQMGLVTIGTFVLIQLYILGLGNRLWDFSRIVRDVYEGYADAKEMIEIMKLPYEIKNTRTAKPLQNVLGEIVFENVEFSFNKTRDVLKQINLKIKVGEKVGLVGPSGSGKTTFARLLLRFYDVASGKILIDGQDIHSITLESLHDNISFVPQDPMLFHRTIMDNIRYGRESATDEEVKEAGRLAHCDEFVDNLPQGYETFVGERGVKLSGGERQRVAIARAILKNSPILVLDEATSSLDSYSESLIQDALDILMNRKTTIVIAHRLSTIRKMDRIIVLENGEIREQGTHSSLIRKNTLYKKLWNLQAGGFMANNREEEE